MDKSLKCSTLIETIVAMLIASIVFTMAFATLLNLFSSSKLYTQAYYELNAFSRMDALKNNLVHGEVELLKEYDFFILKENVSYHSDDLMLLEVFIYDRCEVLKAEVKSYMPRPIIK
ncbi:type IV pilus modification PilV family protein [Saccharicrinis aurantiacus]|uniref:type IV pilus modification PilV family protein n=1 Tax=Saccharicrinis aurantiacus TaxID=1849719 RepID=UPI00083807DB|nr:hypothetical protein [Saccharicrinis aurantiacus]